MMQLPPEIRRAIFDYFDCAAARHNWAALRLTCRQWCDETQYFSAEHLLPFEAFYSAEVMATHSRTASLKEVMGAAWLEHKNGMGYPYTINVAWTYAPLPLVLERAVLSREEWRGLLEDCLNRQRYGAAVDILLSNKWHEQGFDTIAVVKENLRRCLMDSSDRAVTQWNDETHVYMAAVIAGAANVSEWFRRAIMTSSLGRSRELFELVVLLMFGDIDALDDVADKEWQQARKVPSGTCAARIIDRVLRM